MHPAYVAMTSVRVVVTIALSSLVAMAGSARQLGWPPPESANGEILLVLVVVVAATLILLAGTALVSYIYYKRYLWEITDSDVHIYSGIIFKKQIHIPFQRVQSIDFNASLMQRLFGLVRLKIETAGGATNKGVIIPALKLAQAEAFRVEVFARKRTATEPHPAAAQGLAPEIAPNSNELFRPASPLASPLASQPVPPLAPPVQDSADQVVQLVGDSLGGWRGLLADDYDEMAPIECEYGLPAKELLLSAISGDHEAYAK